MKKILFLFFFPIILFSQNENSGLGFLNFYNARISSLGEGYIMNSQNTSGMFGNPAGITTGGLNIEIGSTKYLQDITTQMIEAKTSLNDNYFIGFHLFYTSIPDIEIRTKAGDPEGTFTSQHLSTGISFAMKFSNEISIGLTAKYLFEKIYVNQSDGFGFDFGAMYKFNDKINFGCSISNIGKMSEMNYQKTKLPLILGIGSNYLVDIENIFSSNLINVEFHHNIIDNKFHLSFGDEFNYNQFLFIRLGYITGFDIKGFTSGLGIKYSLINLDYSFIPFSSDIGSSHIINLRFDF